MYPRGYSHFPERIFRTMRDPHHGFPWTGYSGIDLSSTDKSFTAGFRVYNLPFNDASRGESCKYDTFSEYCDEFRSKFHIGDNVNAIIINGQAGGKDSKCGISGQIAKYEIDNNNKRVRVYVRSDEDFSLYEVYPETIFNVDNMYESVRRRGVEEYDKIFECKNY